MQKPGQTGQAAGGRTQPASYQDISAADRAAPVDRVLRGTEACVFGPVPPSFSKGYTDPAQWTLVMSDRCHRRLGACYQGDPIADSLLPFGASQPASSHAGKVGERGGVACGKK